MKKKFIVLFILSVMILTSCSNDVADNDINTDNNTNDKPNTDIEDISKLTVKDYYPFKENNKYVYEGEGNEFASFVVFTDYISENRVQIRMDNGGTEVVKVLENSGGKLIQVLSKEETYYRESFIDNNNSEGEILLKEPFTKGTSWTTGDNIKKTITNVDVEITTPLGKFKSIEVTTEGKDYKILDYYAKDVGLIKTVNSGKDYEVSSTLSKIETDSEFIQNITLFYPNMEREVLNSITKEISFKTNDETKKFIEKAIKDLDRQIQVLSPNANINTLYLNEDGMVYSDFTKELVTEMNAGSLYESMILQSITNTLGTYYGVENVYITVEGKPYESGHIMMKEGEPFKVNLENVESVEE